jgi:O-antigen/teichoic acid export membrane protein
MTNFILKLKRNEVFMRYFKNTSWLFFEKIFRVFLSSLVIIMLTRYLGPEKFGLLSYSQSFVGFFIAISTLGLNTILVRELIKNDRVADGLIGTAFFLKFFVSLFSIFIIWIINYYVSKDDSYLYINIISFSIFFHSFNIIDSFFQAGVISKYSSISNSVAFFISSFLKVIFIYLNADLIIFCYLIVLDVVFVAFGYIYIYLKINGSFLKWRFDKNIAYFFLKSGWPLMFVALASFIYTRTDQVMLKFLLGDEAVGNYAAAVRVSEIFYFIPMLIAQSIFPKIISVKMRSEEEYLLLIEKIYCLFVWISVPICFFVFFFNHEIVKLIYGIQYEKTAYILSFLVFSIFFNSVGVVNTKILYVEHYERKYLIRSVFGVFINVALNFLLIPIYKESGAAISTLITLFFICYVYDIFDKDLHRFYFLKVRCFFPFLLFFRK